MSIESSFNSTLPGPWEAPCGFYKTTSIQADLCCCIPSWNSTYSGRLSKQTFSRTLGDNLTVSGVKRLKDGWLFYLKKVEAKYTDMWLSKCLCAETPVWGESQCTAGTGDWGDLPRCPRLDTFPCPIPSANTEETSLHVLDAAALVWVLPLRHFKLLTSYFQSIGKGTPGLWSKSKGDGELRFI